MSYPLVNGSAINGDDEEASTEGIDLVQPGHHLAVRVGLVAGAQPLETGVPSVNLSLKPPGMDLVRSGAHSIRYNAALKPPGLDLASAGTAQTHSTIYANGAVGLELGAARVKTGVDVELVIGGVELVRVALHGILLALTPANLALEVTGSTVLALGVPRAVAKPITLLTQGYAPLQLGLPRAAQALPVAGASPLDLGTPRVATVVKAKGSSALVLGAPSITVRLGHSGIDLVQLGPAGVRSGSNVLLPAGAAALELGQPGGVGAKLFARAHIALELGAPRIDRGNAC
jgi:hypothetical protein